MNLNDPSDVLRNVYRHNTKPEWGGAVIAWEREGKRGYQFEDGQLRVFTSGHYHLLDVIDVSRDRVRSLLAIVDRTSPGTASAAARADGPSLDEQIDQFLQSHEGGFAGEKWRTERRRRPAGRPLKRHRDPAIEAAQQELAREKLTRYLEEGREVDGLRALVSVLTGTDLVTASQLQQLAAVPSNASRILVAELRELLYGDGPATVRLARWVKALTQATRRTPVWPMATAPLALVYPREHICVQRATFAAQAVSMAPQLQLGPTPSASHYGRLLAMCERVRDALTERGHPPADLFDVSDFLGVSHRP